ncbi:DEAD/DEAH box helicase [Ferrimicrobium sp.]|uniref:DEAD/DEAH box helicase n=1 Tax=Ferrimicrobium sp. TaxID=2926050 RepID=UPI0026059A2E|nr:DEAD/DEAH box helicase [Ferrimicrobium sp.]
MKGPSSLDPLAAAERIQDAFIRYLISTYSSRDETLGQEFRRALVEDPEFRLTKGPYVQATPPYVKGRSLAQLVEEQVLHQGFVRLPETVFPIQRPLYLHQEQAIRKLCTGRNLIISTGTGSGKTESFLFPILHHLLIEAENGTLGSPGVRALLLYPMNALANDQVKRLRELLKCFPEITFGRFIGETPESESDGRDAYQNRFGHDPISNELVSREQMRAQPPHILLSNYAMLEYLLLRPSDTSLFDGPTGRHWHFIVLDEVHVYDGAQAAEVAMLLRRLRDRVKQSRQGEIQFVGTSATLGSGDESYVSLTDYAHRLFDEVFDYVDDDPARQDVIAPQFEPATESIALWTLDPTHIEGLRDHVLRGASVEELASLLISYGAPCPDADVESEIYLGDVLSSESNVVRLQSLLSKGSVSLDRLSADLFGDGQMAQKQLTALIDVCVRARRRSSETPLVPARYHFLIRALEGAFVCVDRGHPSTKPRLLLARHLVCPGCATVGIESRMFEYGTCRRCGAGYLVGTAGHAEDTDLNIFEPAWDLQSDLTYLSVGRDLYAEDEDEAATVDDQDAAVDVDQRELCTSCGTLAEGPRTACRCNPLRKIQVVVAHSTQKGKPLRRCVVCSGRSNAPIVTRSLTGQDAPVAVIATALYQALPHTHDDRTERKIGQGRKLLSFSDSRQDAAFFAPYLDRTYARAIERRMIWEVVQNLSTEEDPRFEDLVIPIRKQAEKFRVLDADAGGKQNSDRVRSWLMREILAVDRRQSLDGVGLAEITVAIPSAAVVPRPLRELGFSETESFDLARVMFDIVKMQAAVSIPESVDINDPVFSPRNVVTSIRLAGSGPGVLAWRPSRGTNRRLEYLVKLFERRGISADPRELLSDIWSKWLAEPRGAWTQVLTADTESRSGTVFRLNHERICFLASSSSHQPYRCSVCHQLWWRSISAVCPTYQCSGTLEMVEDPPVPDDHYRTLYTSLDPIGMRVEEHTAQLGSEYAGQLQEEFLEGDVNVLSCSTTFELGVDVGDVQAVLLHNVPPSPANYVQRAGRAGRRSGSPALVVTYAQRRNHDRHYFDHPLDLIDGHIATPIISLQNSQIARRHLHAIAFAAFERDHVARGSTWHRTVESFFVSGNQEGRAPVDDFVDWLRSRPGELLSALLRTIPWDLATSLGVREWSWVDALTEESQVAQNYGWLKRAVGEVRQDFGDIRDQIQHAHLAIQEATDAGQYSKAERITKYQSALLKERKTLAERALINFLAQRVILPKYGFPVDVVSLDVWRQGDPGAARIDLSRDLSLALTDFAPGSHLVADKALWESIGLRIPAGYALPDSVWVRCGACGAFRSRRMGSEASVCEVCTSSNIGSQRGFLEPIFGFLGKRNGDKPGESRPSKTGFSQYYFSDYAGSPPEFRPLRLGQQIVEVRFSRQGEITVINPGPGEKGFMVCRSCGHAELAIGRSGGKSANLSHEHPRRSSQQCSSTLVNRHLGHQFLTDVVEFRLPLSMTSSEAWSVTYALMAGLHAVGISQRDVSGVSRSTDLSPSSSIILFDTVPGGAGHAQRLAENFAELARAGLDVVRSCECGEDSSCYGCLRSYSNQRLHNILVRGDAIRILGGLLG